MTDKPRVLIFTGEGKGKTTASLGMALRASGHGMKVFILQFIKSDASVGEVAALAQNTNITLRQAGLGFLPQPADPRWAGHQAAAQAALGLARQALAASDCQVVILDEICFAVARGLIQEADIQAMLDLAPAGSVVVLTGREATPGLIAMADTVTEMRCVKHGFRAGRPAQKGVEM